MVVKSACKERLIDLGFPESWAHILADDRKWDDVKELWPAQIKYLVMDDWPKHHEDWEQDLNIEVMEKWLWMNQLHVKFKKGEDERNIIYLGFLDKEMTYYPQTCVTIFQGYNVYRGLGSAFEAPKALKWFILKFSKHTGTAAIGYPADIEEWQTNLLIMMRDMRRLYNAMVRLENMGFGSIAQSINRANITDYFEDRA